MSNNVILRLKSVFFNIKYQEMCDDLPTMYILHNKYPFMIILVRKMRRYALTNQKKNQDATLPDMEVPNLTPTNFEYWRTAFTSVVGRQMILYGISLYLLLLIHN